MSKLYDSIIIGAGSAGITSAIYNSRNGLKTALIEKGLYGGVLHDTSEVENYTSYKSIEGWKLAMEMENHVKAQDNIEHVYAYVKEISTEKELFKVITNRGELLSKTVTIATGVRYSKLGVEGEDKYQGRGISQCITCDINFFRDDKVVIIGGGDSAVEGAVQASNVAKEVVLVHRRDELRAQKVLQDQMFSKDNVRVIWDADTTEIVGDSTKVSGIKYIDKNTGSEKFEKANGIFVNVGVIPNTDFIENKRIFLNEEGFIRTSDKMETALNGLFAIGDVRENSIRQIVSATGDGAIASESVRKYIESL